MEHLKSKSIRLRPANIPLVLKSLKGKNTLAYLVNYDCGFLLANDRTMLAHNPKTMAYCADSVFTYNPLYHPVTVHTRKTVDIMVTPLASYNVYVGTPVYTPQNNVVQTWCSAAYSCGQTTGLNATVSDDGVRVYPSLYNDVFTVETPNTDAWQFSVYSLTGSKLFEQALSGQTRYALDGRFGAKGLYLWRLQRGQSVYRGRIECIR